MGDLDRRAFLKATGSLGLLSFTLPFAPGLLTSLAADEQERPRTLVVLYLRGGMDAMNVVVPFGDPRYYEMRPSIAIAPKDNDWGEGAIAAGNYFGFHPALRPLMPFFESGRLGAIMNVGSPHPTRSHFDAQDFMEYAAPGLRTIKDGWLNRYLALRRAEVKKGADKAAELPDEKLRALAMQGLLPRSLRGVSPVLAVPDDAVLNQSEVLDLFGDIYGKMDGDDPMGKRPDDEENSVLATGQVTIDALNRYKELIGESSGASTEYPGGPLSTKLERLARVIKADAGLEVACIDVPGWDHHAYEGGVTGTLSRMLGDLARSLAAFMTDLGDRLDDTVIMTMTEFGRTCRENGNEGTDHGRGGAMFVMGGKVKGGEILGKWPGLSDAALYEARDLPVTTDFRDVFAEVILRHFEAKLPADFFPDFAPKGMKGLFA